MTFLSVFCLYMLKLVFLHITKNFCKKTYFYTNTLKVATNPHTVYFISFFLVKSSKKKQQQMLCLQDNKIETQNKSFSCVCTLS